MKKTITIILTAVAYLVVIQGCATFQRHYTPMSATDPGPSLESEKEYQIRTKDGSKYYTRGSRTQWGQYDVRILDYKSEKRVTIPIDQISEVRVKKFSATTTAIASAAGVAAVVGIALGIVFGAMSSMKETNE